MSKKCDVCGSDHLPVTKYECTGYNSNEIVFATVNMCLCCDANTNDEWMANYLDWDSVEIIKAIEE